jgi:rubrerythrin
LRRKQTRIICRICGYRFLRKDAEAICPHCASRNR